MGVYPLTGYISHPTCRLSRAGAFTEDYIKKGGTGMNFENILVAWGKDDDLPEGTWH